MEADRDRRLDHDPLAGVQRGGVGVFARQTHEGDVLHAARHDKAAGRKVAVAVLIPDVPISMREREPEWDEAAARQGVSLVAIAPPSAAPELLRKVAERSKGYVYLLSRTGITGTERAAEMPQLSEVEALRKAHAAPLLLGFGISRPEHVKAALQSGADGAIAGSAVTKIIAENLGDHAKMLASLRAFVMEMKAATRLS